LGNCRPLYRGQQEAEKNTMISQISHRPPQAKKKLFFLKNMSKLYALAMNALFQGMVFKFSQKHENLRQNAAHREKKNGSLIRKPFFPLKHLSQRQNSPLLFALHLLLFFLIFATH
jgi:hypothetical protein